MKYKNTLLVVNDIDQSKMFYREVLDQHIILDLGANVTLSCGICLQSIETWKAFIHKDEKDIIIVNHASELYFEINDIDEFMIKLNQYNVSLLHPLKEHTWGQRVVRFYDPDGHIIEVGENLKKVAKRFLSQGLSYEEIAKRMGMPLKFIEKILI